MLAKFPWVIKKTVLPQHTDHAGVMWHGAYINFLEESRIKALEQSGLNYFDLLNSNLELPVSTLSVKYIKPINLSEEIHINSYYETTRSPKIFIYSEFVNKNKIITTKVELNLVLIRKDNFSIVRKRPKFIDEAFKSLCKGPKH